MSILFDEKRWLTKLLRVDQSDADPSTREYHAQFILRDHRYQVGCVAWSLDDSILLTASENYIYMWDARVRVGDAGLTA